MTLANTILASNRDTGPNELYGAFISEGYNLLVTPPNSFNTTITGDTTTNLIDQNPQLAPLADNGGGIKTHALNPGSAAIDKGKSFGATTDQRGFTRIYDEPTISNATGGDGSDIGAFEAQRSFIFVNTNADTDDGACTPLDTGNGCTLREAINAANSTPTSDTISFDAAVFFAPGSHTIQLTSPLPALSTYITIDGPGARVLAVRGEGTADPYSIFTIPSGAPVNISGLTITNGVANSNSHGGGITNTGTLTLQNVAVSGNPASTVANASGGIFNSGTMTIQSSTISGNFSGSVGNGGGIFNNPVGVLTLQNSTVSGNTARSGGGIHNLNTLTLQNSTVSGNTAIIRGGGIGGLTTTTLRSSIVAGNSALSLIPDIDATVQSDGYNLIGDTNGATINQNPGAGPDITDVDAQLGALADNGGPTDTHALALTSPAIDKGNSFGATTDQRGFIRAVDISTISDASDGADIGAFELQASISGTVSYGITPENEMTKFVPDVALIGEGTPQVSSTTGSNGTYLLSGFGNESYIVTPSKSGQVNGISNADATAVAQFVAGLNTLTENQQKAADVSNNGAVSSLDASYIAQYIAMIPNPGLTGSWRFNPVNRTYPSVQTNFANENYSAILMGEVTGNWNPAIPRPAESDAAERRTVKKNDRQNEGGVVPATVSAPNPQTVGVGANFAIELTASDTNGRGIFGYEFNFLYDAAVIVPQATPCDAAGTLSDTAIGRTVICNPVSPGLLRVVMFSSTGTPLSGAGVLLKLNFTAVGMGGTSSALTFQNFMFNEGIPQAITVNGQVQISGPTVAAAAISGRALTITGRGISDVRITITGFNGESRTVTTNSAGYYRIENLRVGQTYTISASAKRYSFRAQAVSVGDNLVNLDLIAEP